MTNRFAPRLRAWAAILTVGALAALAACETNIAPPFQLEGTGTLEGRVFLDVNEDGIYDPPAGDQPLSGVTLLLLERGTARTLRQTDTDAQGRFRMDELPPGTHDLLVDEESLPEGVVCLNPQPVSVFRHEPHFRDVRAQIACLISIAEAKALPEGEVVNVRGIVTVQPGQHRAQGDDMYIQDASGGIKIFGGVIGGWNVQVGDLVDVTATRGFFSLGREIQLLNPRLNERVADVGAPQPKLVTTGYAATQGAPPEAPDAGMLVRIERARMETTFQFSGNRNARFDDGTGVVAVRIDPGVIASTADINPRFTVGACYNITGSLTPFAGAADIKPRSMDDVQEVPCE